MSSPKKEEWTAALNAELESINSNESWVISSLPEGRKAISCKEVWKRKFDDGGRVARYKARIVAKGYHQKYGVNYDETFAPVLSYDVLLMTLGMYVSKVWVIHHADISTAFLNVIIDGEIYVGKGRCTVC